jgi:hypothetical protein
MECITLKSLYSISIRNPRLLDKAPDIDSLEQTVHFFGPFSLKVSVDQLL